MRTTIVAALLLVPSLALSQSLGEVAKKERERREKNKEEGKEAIVISEEDLYPEGRPEPSEESAETSTSTQSPPRASADEGTPSSSEYTDEELERLEAEDVPDFIPPDAPLEQRIEIFQRMRTYYEQQVRELDDQIAKNQTRIDELEVEIGATSAMGGAGLPVPPQPGTDSANRQLTGQESQSLVAEQNRLRALNEQLQQRKEQLRLNLQQRGRAAGIPAGYLRF